LTYIITFNNKTIILYQKHSKFSYLLYTIIAATLLMNIVG